MMIYEGLMMGELEMITTIEINITSNIRDPGE